MDAAAEKFAIGLARRAGDLMRANFSLGTKKTWKEDHSPLTVTDTAINDMVIEAVRDAYPGHAVIGEEESWGDGRLADWTWVCDPIDGTIPFSHGYPTFAFSLGLAHHGEAVLGVVYDPMLDRLVVARKGHGATLNGEPVKVDGLATLQHSVVALELPAHFKDIRSQLRDLGCFGTSMHSFVYEGMLLGIGEFAGAIYAHDKPWDVCALDVIIKEAGGVATNVRGEANAYNGLVNGFVAAANETIHQQLLELINR
jgi:myo-inositol-1(or 4)-monophosphatase